MLIFTVTAKEPGNTGAVVGVEEILWERGEGRGRGRRKEDLCVGVLLLWLHMSLRSLSPTHSAFCSILTWTGGTLIDLQLAVLPLPARRTHTHILVHCILEEE